MAIRTANAEWKGDLQGGAGSFSGSSGQLGGAYSFESRFTDSGGTNPEELVAAAQAACYSMQLAAMLAMGGTTADSISTDAKVQETAKAAHEACLISKALGAVPEHNLEARLES